MPAQKKLPATRSSHNKKIQTPEEWVREQLEFSDDEGNQVAKFRIEGRSSRRERFRALVNVLRKEKDTPRTICERIDAQSSRCMVPEICVSAWLRAHHRQPVSLYQWPVEYENQDEEDDDQDGNHDGLDGTLYRQLAKHNEVLMSNFMQVTKGAMVHLAAQNERFEQERERLMTERVETFDAYKRVLDDSEERKLKSERWSTIGDTLKTLGEATAFRMTQGNVAPDAQSSVLLRSLHLLGDSISPEQAQALQQILNSNQLTLLATLFTDPATYSKRAIEQKAPAEPAPDAPNEPPPTPIKEHENASPPTMAKPSPEKKRRAKVRRKKTASN